MKFDEALKGVVEGILLTNYLWDQKTQNETERLVEEVTLIGALPKFAARIEELKQIAEGVYMARDLINGNADTITPSYLVGVAEKLSRQFPAIKTTILDKKRLEKEGMGLILAVGRGAVHEPALIVMHYNGHPSSKERTVFVGKGVTL